MRGIIRTMMVAAAVLLAVGPQARANDLNEVGAILVYPIVIGAPGQETFLTITNSGASPAIAHIALIDGREGTPQHPNPRYCFECDFDLPLTAQDTELLVITPNCEGGIDVLIEDSGQVISCDMNVGMVVVSLQDAPWHSVTDNVLLGAEVVVDYGNALAYSLPAIPFQGRNGGDGNRHFRFDDVEYGRFPRVVAADFIAPDRGNIGPVTADVALFTLGFDRQHPPRTDCSVTGFDAEEHSFSTSLLFGCWTVRSLWDISPEFAYPNLGQLPGQNDSHGWFQADCRVDRARDGVFELRGGVHGALVQTYQQSPAAARPPFRSTPSGDLGWARLLSQSVTTGDPVTLKLSSLYD